MQQRLAGSSLLENDSTGTYERHYCITRAVQFRAEHIQRRYDSGYDLLFAVYALRGSSVSSTSSSAVENGGLLRQAYIRARTGEWRR
jgi:hypothetical protein